MDIRMVNLNLLLITTLPNSVFEYIKTCKELVLHVIDLKDNYSNIGEQIEDFILNQKTDLILTYRCPYILPEKYYSVPSLGAYNIHPSLLPKYPGLNPWTNIFACKERINGVTLHKISSNVDAGEIIYQESYKIKEYDTIDIVRQNADRIAAKLAGRLINHHISSDTDILS